MGRVEAGRRQGLRLALAGIVIGLMGSLALGRLLDRLLFGVKAYDPLTLLTAFGGALAVALLAGYVPARRATRVDPNDLSAQRVISDRGIRETLSDCPESCQKDAVLSPG
jgi:uncharacterized membrane protein YeaQ/YmgE (transglycosylase-associated protein family)